MRLFWTVAVLALGELMLPPVWAVESSARATGPTELKGFYREGQTFLTWKEDGAVTGEWYRVYADAKPITSSRLKDVQLIARIPEGSREYRWKKRASPKLKKMAFRYAPHAAKCFEGIQLEDDENAGKILPKGTGVFVRTIKAAGTSFYAVTVESTGKENTTARAGINCLAVPIKEQVGTPGAILVARTKPNGYIYLFFTDYETWNPDKTDDNAEGYAHLCHVVLPKDADGTKTFPLSVRLHAYTAWQDWLAVGRRDGVGLSLLDYRLTWWYGYSDALPKMEGSRYARHPVKGTVYNFTEQRVIQAINWLIGKPANCKGHVDLMRVSVFGGSMGGTGVHVLGLRHGEVFAAGRATVGLTNWALPKRILGWSLARHVGPLERNDMTNERARVYDLLDLPQWLGDHPEIETPYLDTSHGIIDGVICFHSVPDFYAGLERGKHPYTAAWGMWGHSGTSNTGGPMKCHLMRRDEPLPAFANASCNTRLNSGFRIVGRCEKVESKAITIKKGALKRCPYSKDGNFPPDLAGKTLVVYPHDRVRTWFKIASSTPTTVAIKDGDLVAYAPPVNGWNITVWKQKNKREPTPEDLKALARERKHFFLICDGEPRGSRNGYFAWSTRNQNFAANAREDDIVDRADEFGISIRLVRNRRFGEYRQDTATVDVTPRRTQHFRPAPGARVKWQNVSQADPKNPRVIAQGEVVADKHGLVTVPKFTVGKAGWGNRLVLRLK